MNRCVPSTRPVRLRVTVIEPGYIESEMTARTAKTMLMVDNATGVAKMVTPSNGEKGRAIVPGLAVAAIGRHAQGPAAAVHQTFRGTPQARTIEAMKHTTIWTVIAGAAVAALA